MENKKQVVVNVFYKTCVNFSNGDGLCQFSKTVSLDGYNKIVAFLKDCPLTKAPIEQNIFYTFAMFTVTCSNEEDALTILHGLEGCIKTEVEEDSTPKNNSISSEIEYIAHNLDDSDLFLQLAEEAAELSQACL